MLRRSAIVALLFCALLLQSLAVHAQQPGAQPAAPPRDPNDPIERIKDEGMNRSQVMQTLSYLSDVIGPRLTGSPNLKRANEWTRDKLASWGLQNAHLEAWGPFGRGWTLKSFSAQVSEPQDIPLIAYPKAWSPGLNGTLNAEVIYVDAKDEAGLEQYKGKLKGAIVLTSPMPEVKAHFEPLGTRRDEKNLLSLADAPDPRSIPRRPPQVNPQARAEAMFQAKKQQFFVDEGAALLVDPSRRGDGGTIFVQSATVAQPFVENPFAPGAPRRVSPWDKELASATSVGEIGIPECDDYLAKYAAFIDKVPEAARAQFNLALEQTRKSWRQLAGNPKAKAGLGQACQMALGQLKAMMMKDYNYVPQTAARVLPQIVVAAEHYNRIVRMIQAGEKVKMAVNLDVQFHDDDPMAYNTVAEIPGTDPTLKDEIVMLGGHMDSWHSGTGATDNGAGVATAMEAVRILQALKLQPRRTIRVALWSGEEEGLYGSRYYVMQHFGTIGDGTIDAFRAFGQQSPTPPQINPKPDYDKLSAYFNLDNGTGRIRGVYLQGNELVRPLFRQWLAPFRDMNASTLSISNTGGTDHLSFDAIGLPGFQFIQDEIEYDTRTHHSNQDVFDRVIGDDMKQNAVIMAAFVYQAAMMDAKMPRKVMAAAK